MKRSNKTSQSKNDYEYSREREVDWELRPGGLLVQKRTFGDLSSNSMINIKVSHRSSHYHLTVPAQSTFGDLKRVIAAEIGVEPKEQRLLFRGKEKEDDDCLHMVGVKEMSKVILLEDPASKEMKKDGSLIKAYEAVVRIRAEVDQLADKVVSLETTIHGGTEVAEKEILVLTELFMVLLLKLDTIEADGVAKVLRRTEVHRVQTYIDMLDNLKAGNSNSLCSSINGIRLNRELEA